jgi:hypothetical protein
MSCGCCGDSASAAGGKFDYQYAVKIVCGLIKAESHEARQLPPGEYFTKTNIHNFSRCDCVTFRWKIAISLPLKVGPISDFTEATLCPDEAFEISSDDVLRRVEHHGLGHVEGWLVIETPSSAGRRRGLWHRPGIRRRRQCISYRAGTGALPAAVRGFRSRYQHRRRIVGSRRTFCRDAAGKRVIR